MLWDTSVDRQTEKRGPSNDTQLKPTPQRRPVDGVTVIVDGTRFSDERHPVELLSVALTKVPAVQPVKAGATGCDEAVVVVDGGTGPVNETTSVSVAESENL